MHLIAILLLLLVFKGRGVPGSEFQFVCTKSSEHFSLDQLCSSSTGQNVTSSLCKDQSDVKYCTDEGLFTGCLTYEPFDTFHIVPCQECSCHFEIENFIPTGNDRKYQAKICPWGKTYLSSWKHCRDQFNTSQEFKSIVTHGTMSDSEKLVMVLGGDWQCHDGSGKIVPCSRAGAEYFLRSYYPYHGCRPQFWRHRPCVRKPFSYAFKCPEEMAPCGHICSLQKEPCNGNCRDGLVTCPGKEEICVPDNKHCCGNQDMFYCKSETACVDKSKKKLCQDGSCRNRNETCPSCPEGQSFCEAANRCEDWQACQYWDDFPPKVKQEMRQNSCL